METAFWVAGAVLAAAAAGYGWGRRVGWTRPHVEWAEARATQAAPRASRESEATRPESPH